jgi:hypothetical protein
MMNILPRNPADREAKSPCDKNIRYPVCVPRHDSPPNGTTFLTIEVYDKQKTALVEQKTTLVDHPSDLINTRRLSPCRKPIDLRPLAFLARRQSTVWSGHLDHPLAGGFLQRYLPLHLYRNLHLPATPSQASLTWSFIKRWPEMLSNLCRPKIGVTGI